MRKILGGYKGYYNEMPLDSSYEYIYCKILERKCIDFKVHERCYQLKDRQYTPDFFIYENNILSKIVEVRGHRLNIDQRISDIEELSKILQNVECLLITEVDIRKMCKDCGLSYNKLKTEWRANGETILNRNDGVFNAMYGKKQSEKSKQISREKGIKRFKENPEKYYKLCTSKLIEYNIKHNFAQAKSLEQKELHSYVQRVVMKRWLQKLNIKIKNIVQ